MSEFNPGEIFGVSIVLFGFAAFLMGQAIADTWRPSWQNVPYGLLLALGNHFIDCALFAHRVTLVRKMVRQYPWLYERNGLLSWRERAGGDRDVAA